MSAMPRLTVIGAGKVGRALCRLWYERGIFHIGDVLNRRHESALEAVSFIGAGRAVEGWSELTRADLYMLSVPDDAIEACAEKLAQANGVDSASIAFHCSGSRPSSALGPLELAGARIASLHPVKSFADPREAAASFAGTPCALEGHRDACDILQAAVERCGARVFKVDAANKLLYHAGTVFASNYLVALAEVALICFERAGIPRPQGLSIAMPLLRGTLENVGRLGTAEALTGPIARGDADLVRAQQGALDERDQEIAALYALLGRFAVALATEQGGASSAALARIHDALTDRH